MEQDYEAYLPRIGHTDYIERETARCDAEMERGHRTNQQRNAAQSGKEAREMRRGHRRRQQGGRERENESLPKDIGIYMWTAREKHQSGLGFSFLEQMSLGPFLL